MKVAIVVHGRFHAFDLARALVERGIDTTVFTNYPKSVAARFGVPRQHVRSHVLHGALARLLYSDDLPFREIRERAAHILFGRWARRALAGGHYDVKHVWSGVAEEAFKSPTAGTRLLMRGSAHIRTQSELLVTEERRVGGPLPGPTRWMIAREEREYQLADRIIVFSRFARDSFVQQGVPSARIRLLPLGSDLATFRPTEAVAEARRQRILAERPLRILYVGGLTLRKGMWDLVQVARALPREDFQLRLVGFVSRELRHLRWTLMNSAEVVGKVPQRELREHYDWADIFVFPTLEDGYAVVLAQAVAGGLPIITTTNCSGPDFIEEGHNGWIVPIRSSEAFIERLRWCHANRLELAEMASRVYTAFKPRDWQQVAADFEALCEEVR
jgi:glycosyltransferase involved in cell wall biosynthesis